MALRKWSNWQAEENFLKKFQQTLDFIRQLAYNKGMGKTKEITIMKTLIIKYNNYADNGSGLKTKKIVAKSYGSLIVELAAWLMQPTYTATPHAEHIVRSIGWQGEGQFELANSNADNFVDVVKKLLMEEVDVDNKILQKAQKYDEIIAKRTDAAKRSAAARTPEARRLSAQKAVNARWHKVAR